ncbi:hypothetical protein [uncultured Mailhella sp.]|uniref:hypothetical protein n=1 Tax=uncultured Mailhella sp. TaxID=1981031 RepID=UPI00320AAF9E
MNDQIKLHNILLEPVLFQSAAGLRAGRHGRPWEPSRTLAAQGARQKNFIGRVFCQSIFSTSLPDKQEKALLLRRHCTEYISRQMPLLRQRFARNAGFANKPPAVTRGKTAHPHARFDPGNSLPPPAQRKEKMPTSTNIQYALMSSIFPSHVRREKSIAKKSRLPSTFRGTFFPARQQLPRPLRPRGFPFFHVPAQRHPSRSHAETHALPADAPAARIPEPSEKKRTKFP